MSLSDFEFISEIGRGAYSTVFKVRRAVDNRIYALKKVSIEKLSDKEKKNALNEVRILASINHPNVIAYKESFISEEDKSLCLVMEYADSGDLLQRLIKCKKRSVRLSESFIWSMFTQLTLGLKALHDLGVFHRDIKSANVFLNKNGTIKLGDMNVSKVSKDGFLKTQTGTPYYASPEVWKDMKYNNKSDIWSVGCVMYEAVMLMPPFRANDMKGLHDKVLEGVYEPMPRVYSEELTKTIDLLLNPDPDLRPSCDQILMLEQVLNNMNCNSNLKTISSLIDPIKLTGEISILNKSLPYPTYENSVDTTLKQIKSERVLRYDKTYKLPNIKSIGVKRDTLFDGKAIRNREDRMNRIKCVYLSPSNAYLSPIAKKRIVHKAINKGSFDSLFNY